MLTRGHSEPESRKGLVKPGQGLPRRQLRRFRRTAFQRQRAPRSQVRPASREQSSELALSAQSQGRPVRHRRVSAPGFFRHRYLRAESSRWTQARTDIRRQSSELAPQTRMLHRGRGSRRGTPRRLSERSLSVTQRPLRGVHPQGRRQPSPFPTGLPRRTAAQPRRLWMLACSKALSAERRERWRRN